MGLSGRCFICLRPPPLLSPQTPPLQIVYVYTVNIMHTGKGGWGELTREKVREAVVHKAGRNTNMTVYKLY
jgi:hypothetical protein